MKTLSNNLLLLPVAVAIFAAGPSVATTSYCPGNADTLCFQWGVPEASASAGAGNVYIQLRASTSLSWAGLGIGSRMAGADIFIIYQDGNGNVTLSTRAGTGNVMPLFADRQGVELIEGSGVVDGQMVANIRCSDCASLDLSGSNDWISAWLPGSSLDSLDPAETIDIHADYSRFQVDMAQATVDSDQNPFLATSNDNNNNNADDDGGSGSGSGSSDDAVTEQSYSNTETIQLAHGVIMSIVFVAAYPIGAVLMPLIGKWFIHAAWQMLAFLAMWAGFALGYICAHREGAFFNQAHTRLGTIIVALLALQPVLGGLHHWSYQKNQSRGVLALAHVWYGRVLIILGIINGGLGLQLAGIEARFVAAYSVVAGIIGIAYIGLAVMGEKRRLRSAQPVEKQRPYHVTSSEGGIA